MLRISQTKRSGSVVSIAGGLEGEFVAELERVCVGAELPLTVDCSDLRSADSAGIELLVSLVEGGVPLVGLSSYLDARLRRASQSDGSNLSRTNGSGRSEATQDPA